MVTSFGLMHHMRRGGGVYASCTRCLASFPRRRLRPKQLLHYLLLLLLEHLAKKTFRLCSLRAPYKDKTTFWHAMDGIALHI